MSALTNVHRVVSITVERIEFGDFHSTEFILTDDAGIEYQFCAMSKTRLAVNDLGSRLAHGVKRIVAEAVETAEASA